MQGASRVLDPLDDQDGEGSGSEKENVTHQDSSIAKASSYAPAVALRGHV